MMKHVTVPRPRGLEHRRTHQVLQLPSTKSEPAASAAALSAQQGPIRTGSKPPAAGSVPPQADCRPTFLAGQLQILHMLQQGCCSP